MCYSLSYGNAGQLNAPVHQLICYLLQLLARAAAFHVFLQLMQSVFSRGLLSFDQDMSHSAPAYRITAGCGIDS